MLPKELKNSSPVPLHSMKKRPSPEKMDRSPPNLVRSSMPGVQAKNDPAVRVMVSCPLIVRWTTRTGAGRREDDLTASVGCVLADEQGLASRQLADEGAAQSAEQAGPDAHPRVHPGHGAALGDKALAWAKLHSKLAVVGIAVDLEFHRVLRLRAILGGADSGGQHERFASLPALYPL